MRWKLRKFYITKDYANLLKELYNKRELIKLSKSLELEAGRFDHEKKSLRYY